MLHLDICERVAGCVKTLFTIVAEGMKEPMVNGLAIACVMISLAVRHALAVSRKCIAHVFDLAIWALCYQKYCLAFFFFNGLCLVIFLFHCRDEVMATLHSCLEVSNKCTW